MDRTLTAWHIQQEEFGSSLSGYRADSLGYIMGIANTEEEINSYLDLKHGKDTVERRLIFIRKIEITQLTVEEIQELRTSCQKVNKNE